ncbi:MAG TPA: imidazole glycerol phosphate synthase subunit HisH [Firmicutes bacterium]|nr:imidazole glycerol phosphate synthase subunit HisH [Bacillota bacterium]
MKKIAVIDYGMGNLHSVVKALENKGVPVKVVSKGSGLKNCIGIVLPGVGAFGDAVKEIKKREFYGVVIEMVNSGIPILGICLGMQLLMEKSTEYGRHKGFGFIKGDTVIFKGDMKIPHMGWNRIEKKKKDSVLSRIKDGSFAYFVHSYYVKPDDARDILTETQYGKTAFTSSVSRDKVYGFQFHPEKSGREMLKIYENFSKICGA